MSAKEILRKTQRGFWERTHYGPIRYQLPSLLNIGTANIIRLLRPRVQPRDSVLEIGFAPGKILAYLAIKCEATVCGLDYSEQGISVSRDLFRRLGIQADLRCEDLFDSTFAKSSFDFVYSLGFLEHFDNPELVVERHHQYLKPGGHGLIAIPNYGGIYGSIQARFDPDNLKIHNLNIMQPDSLRRLATGLDCSEIKVYRFGRVNPWLMSLDKKWPQPLAQSLNLIGNVAGLLQPMDVPGVCPLLVMEFTRGK